MVAREKSRQVTPAEYLLTERISATRHEYRDGIVVAMAGASRQHSRITVNLTRRLAEQLEGTDCENFDSDLRVRVPLCNRYYYPDATVVCGEPQFEDAELDTLLNPTVLFEVLSPSTLRTDYEDKWDCYRTLESLRVFVLVSQSKCRVETYTRQSDSGWQHDVFTDPDALLTLNSEGCRLKLAEIYARVRFDERAAPPPGQTSEAEEGRE